MNRCLLVGFWLLAGGARVHGADPYFDSYWHDGKAELDGYRLTIARYGQPRAGRGVLVYVAEPFSESQRVKVDDPRQDPADTFDAFKLNLVRDFQTGIYNYSTMVSVFVRSADLFLKPGGHKTVPLLPGVVYGRLSHTPPAWTTAEIARPAELQPLEVPAGKFDAAVYTVKIAGGREGTFCVEAAYPHRIVRWEMTQDISAELAGSARLQYWKLHANGDQRYLKQLGIQPAVAP